METTQISSMWHVECFISRPNAPRLLQYHGECLNEDSQDEHRRLASRGCIAENDKFHVVST